MHRKKSMCIRDAICIGCIAVEDMSFLQDDVYSGDMFGGHGRCIPHPLAAEVVGGASPTYKAAVVNTKLR